MMHLRIFTLWYLACFFGVTNASAQGVDIDSLKARLEVTSVETERILLSADLYNELARVDPDSAIRLTQEALKRAKKIHFPEGEARLMCALGVALTNVGDYASAIKHFSSTLAYIDTTNDVRVKFRTYNELCVAYKEQSDYAEALKYSTKSINLLERLHLPPQSCEYCRGVSLLRATIYLEQYQLDSAKKYIDKAFSYPPTPLKAVNASTFDIAGRIQAGFKNYDKALEFYRQGIHDFLNLPQVYKGLPKIYNSMAMLWNAVGRDDSARFYLHKSLAISRQRNFLKEILDANMALATVYEDHDSDSALFYYKQAIQTKDLLFDQEKQRQIASYQFDLELQQQQTQNAQAQYRSQLKIYSLLGIAFVLLTVGFVLWRNSDRRRKDLLLLREQKAETDRQKDKAEQTIVELRSTQAQLIQSEKMASLGELTAGIAHEIQNPLNFVNNFSEVNAELIDDLKKELASGNRVSADELADAIKENEVKINQHGKRADGIVKSMLQHSRSSSGQKEMTDINALCEEYLRLTFHGYRAKDKSFNATFETSLDQGDPKLNVMQQEIGRVLLNLINNAFYSVNEKAKHGIEGYVPKIVVSTKKLLDKVEIRVRDNGIGIPASIKEKIFQPFFTTKPAGQGTGLGLSLAYDIINKAHGGELKVESEEGAGCEFIILLPILKKS